MEKYESSRKGKMHKMQKTRCNRRRRSL